MFDDRSVNSNAAQCIAVLKNCLAAMGWNHIELVLEDRDFIGHTWFQWLQDNGLPYVMRVAKHHHVTPLNGEYEAFATLSQVPEQVRWLTQVQVQVQVDGV